MNTTAEHKSRCRRLMASTDDLHEDLHVLVDRFGPFKAVENYGPWVEAQYIFQQQLLGLYEDKQVAELLPDAAHRSRLQAAAKDLAFLGHAVPTVDAVPYEKDLPLIEALAWLFVSEGSTLGAAKLIKYAEALGLSANEGASHLAAESPAARMTSWKQFTAVIDGLQLSDAEEEQMLAAAKAAFVNFRTVLEQCFEKPLAA